MKQRSLPCGTYLVVFLAVITFLSAEEVDFPTQNVNLSELPFLDNSSAKEVIILTNPPPGYEPATTDEEWAPIFRDNLQRDLAKYVSYVKKDKKLSLRLIGIQIKRLMASNWQKRTGLALIRNNKIYSHLPPGNTLAHSRVLRNLQVLAEYSHKLNLDLPDTVFIHNVYDESMCRKAGDCLVPVFSIYKRFDSKTNKSIDDDVLFPHMRHIFNNLIFFPWKDKDPRGLHRATMQESMSAGCVRMKLANLSSTPEGAKFLDVGFSANRNKKVAMPESFKKKFVPMSDHARYKFLINANGHVASSRRGHIMQCNSVVLEQQTVWIEYFWRSLAPGVHYLPYTSKTIIPLLQKYRDPARDGELRAMVNASQHFAAKYLTIEGKVRYAVRLLHEYTKLFDGISDFVQSYKGLKPETKDWVRNIGMPSGMNETEALANAKAAAPRYPAGGIDCAHLIASLQKYNPSAEG